MDLLLFSLVFVSAFSARACHCQLTNADIVQILWGPGVVVAKRVTKDSIERLKASFRLEDFLRGYVELKRMGGFFQGKCPFHNDDSPSFTVYPDHYYCFGCKANGDAITFLIERDGLRFQEAVEAVAGRMGATLDYEDDKDVSPEQERREKARKEAFYVMQEVADLYHRLLVGPGSPPQAKRALAYLEGRGYGLERVKQFRLGLCTDKSVVCEEGARRGWPRELLERIGLINPSVRLSGSHYDFFRDRILVPIQDEKGNVIGFGGRAYLPSTNPEFKEPKYKNSRESEIFSKSAVVYNLHRARGAIARTGSVLLVEGYFDCLTLFSNGVENVVAALSTSIGPQHLDKLANVARAKELIVSFDSDAAGQSAALAFFQKVFPLGRFTLRYLAVPDGKDPDEFVRARGKEAFLEVLSRARPLLERVCEIACQGVDARDSEKRLSLLREKVLPALAEHPDAATKDLALQSVASFLKLSDHRLLVPSAVRGGSVSPAGRPGPAGISASPILRGRGQLASSTSTAVGPSWLAGTAERKFLCALVFAERSDMPQRIRILSEGLEASNEDEALRVEVCESTLSRALSEDSKSILRDVLHMQQVLGGKAVVGASFSGELSEMTDNLRILVALARGDEAELTSLGALGLRQASAAPLAFRRAGRDGGNKEADAENAFAPRHLSLVLRALVDAECSARQGTLKNWVERALAMLELEHLKLMWRLENRALAELVASAAPGREELEARVSDLHAALEMVAEELEPRKKHETGAKT